MAAITPARSSVCRPHPAGCLDLPRGQRTGPDHPDEPPRPFRVIVPPDRKTARPEDLVEGQPSAVEVSHAEEGRSLRPAGPPGASLIAIHAHDIPVEFDPQAVSDAEASKPVSAKGRTDLRKIAGDIDGADARDFDDAVWAEKDGKGWHLIVAIADVSWYVRAGKPLDREAFNRGNSVFPDRVVPMLPEALSSGLCSLVPNEDRGCLAVHMWIDKDGNLKRHEFVRGIADL